MFGSEDISLLWVAFFVTTVAVIASVCYSRCSSPTLDGCKRTVVVTGAASGLGRATCHKLAATGDFVVAMDMNESLLQTLLVRICGDAQLRLVRTTAATKIEQNHQTTHTHTHTP